MSRNRLRLPGLLAALALAAVAAWPLLSAPGLVNTRAGGDSPFLLLRVYEMQANLRAGALPARWMPHAAYGLGYPFFSYYAALPYYLAAILSLAGAGVLWAIKLTQLVGFLGAAAAMYALADELLDDPLAALLAAAAYTFAPFHVVNVYVRGDSLSEFYAFIFYALIVWGAVRLRRAPTVGNLAFLAVSYGALTVTHTVSAFIFSPLAGLVLVWAALTAPRARLRVFLMGAVALLLGAAMGAWYWLPALLERGLVSLGEMTTGYFHYSGHFRGRNLVQPGLLFDYTLDGGHTPFAIGGLQAALVVGGLAVIAGSWVWRRRLRWADLALVPLVAYAVWPITPSSAVAWESLPLLPMVQFPWRFLSIVALATALVAAVALSRLGWLRWLAPVLALGLAVSALARLPVEPLPLREQDITVERLQLYEHVTSNIGSTVRAEYLPAAAVPRPFTSAALIRGEEYPPPAAGKGQLGEVRLLSAGPEWQVWEVTVESAEAVAIFQTYDFAGWRATVDGAPAEILAGAANGRIALEMREGKHRVELSLGPTAVRAAAERASLIAMMAAAVLVVAGLWRSRRHWLRMLAVVAVGGALLAGAALAGALAARAAPAAGTLSTETMDYLQMPYLHPNPQGLAFGSSVRLAGYELAPRTVRPGERLYLRLHWQSDDPRPLTAVVRLTTASEAFLSSPPLAASEGPLAQVSEHTFTVPPELAPGLALLAVEVRSPDGLLAAHTPRGTSLGTTYLSPVRVLAPEAAPDVPAQARLGRHVDLLEGSVAEVREGVLRVHVTWRPTAPLGQDYATSVRLWAPDGRQVPGAALDVQPRYGLYPTSLWAVDVPVADYYELRIPAGTPPGEGYQVELTLYDVQSLQPLGSVRLPPVALRRPTVRAEVPILQAFDCGLAIVRWHPERLEVADGEEVAASVQWTARAAPLPEVSARLSLVDEQGRAVTTAEAPLSALYPTSRWPLHALVNSRAAVHVPPGTSPGRYRLLLELRDAGGGLLGQWSPGDPILVKAAERNRTLPSFACPLGVRFGEVIALPGYDLERTGERVAVTLHWQALAAPGRDYKVFLHCFDPATEKIVAQRDAMPLADTYPTSRWAEGEVVSDRLVLDMAGVPSGRYQLAVGWYDPLTGERLEPVGDPARTSQRRVLLQQLDW
ncbi:MAG: hypothetical protein K6V36_02795 [Anaerolineae bacterium]|nr:hypothetical protein [Anaerolineae bacterium]